MQQTKKKSQSEKRRKTEKNLKYLTREEFFRYLEEDRRKWEENQKRWEENQKIIERITKSIAKVGARVGYKMEDLVRALIKEFFEKNGIKPDTKPLKEFDQEGFVYGYPSDVEIDVFVSDPVVYGEVKSIIEDASEVLAFNRKVEFFERKYGKAWKKFITCLDIKERRRESILQAAEKYGIDIIEA